MADETPTAIDAPEDEFALEAGGPPADDETGTGTGVEVIDAVYDTSRPTVSLPVDHFTLSVPTTTIRYRRSNNAARIIEDSDKQYILEEADNKDGSHGISIRKINDSSEGVRFLRATYALATAFWTGFLFVFCIQIILFVFLDMAIQCGITSGDNTHLLSGIGVMLSVFPFIYGLSSAMVIAGVYVMDTARGHPLTRNFTFKRLKDTTVDWVYFIFFIGLPTVSLCVTLFMGEDDFWAITGLIWFISILIFFSIFVVNVIFYELKACFEVMRNKYPDEPRDFCSVLTRGIYLRQVATYGGYKSVSFLSMGSIVDAEHTDSSDAKNVIEGTRTESISWRAKVTAYQGFLCMGMYEILDTPQQIYSIDDARDVRPFLTKHTWSLEKIFCRPRNSRYIAIVRGPGALTRGQIKSSVACTILGSFLVFLLMVSLLTYLQAGVVGTIFLCIIAFFIALPNFKSTFRLLKLAKDLILVRTDRKEEAASGSKSARSTNFSERENEDTVMGPTESEGLYITVMRYRVTRPTRTFAAILFGLEFFFFFFWPLTALFAIGNWPMGGLYFITAFFTGLRYYINVAVVLEETGHMDLVDGKSEREVWRNKSRLDDIVGNITRGRSRRVWNSILGFFGLIFLALFAGTIGAGQEDTAVGADDPFTYLDNFEYQQLDALKYPTCTLTSDLGESPLKTMADYAYLAGNAYRGTDGSPEEVAQWFGTEITDEIDLVETIRRTVVDSKVSFKIMTAPTSSGSGRFAYLTIRGTTNQWDAMTDAQLWAPAALMQFLRIALPFGHIWTPVMPALINAITTLESESINSISFYKDTVQIVKFLQASGDYVGVAVTGHSLGGGLSIMTGAIAKVPAVALSGPNAVLSRRSTDPKISTDDLDKYTFNIIPKRDVVPMLDDRSQNFQIIDCNAGFVDVVGCHSTLRSLCEIMYTCGSDGRPVLCECVTQMHFPEPLPIGDTNVTFTDACIASAAARNFTFSDEL